MMDFYKAYEKYVKPEYKQEQSEKSEESENLFHVDESENKNYDDLKKQIEDLKATILTLKKEEESGNDNGAE